MRSNGQQRVHDQVIESVAKQLAAKYPRDWIHTNPGTAQRFGVTGQFPDIVLTDESGVPHAIYEVETSDSVTASHAGLQWPSFAGLGLPLYIVVPEREEPAVKKLLRELRIRVAKLVLY